MLARRWIEIIAALAFVGCGNCAGTEGQELVASTSAVASAAPVPSAVDATSELTAPGTPPPPSPSAVPALDDAAADARVAGPDVRVELLGNGAEPRAVLRHAAKLGARVALTVGVDVGMVQTKEGDDPNARAVPGFSLDTNFVRAATGWRVTVEGAKAEASGDAEALLAEEVAPLMRALGGKSALFGIEGRASSFVAPPVPAGLDLEAAQLWSSLEETVRELAVPLPEEPVGVGARWRSVSRRSRAGIAIVRTASYRLDEGAGVVLHFTFREEPVATKLRDPLLPQGIEVAVRSGIGQGQGKLELERDLAPRALDVELESWNDLAVKGPGAATPEFSTLRLHQRIRATRKP